MPQKEDADIYADIDASHAASRESQRMAAENDYHSRRHSRFLSPDRNTYKDAMARAALEKEEAALKRALHGQRKSMQDAHVAAEAKTANEATPSRKRRRWDLSAAEKEAATATPRGDEWAAEQRKVAETPRRSRWDQTPQMIVAETPSKRSRWDQTPMHVGAAAGETPTRWDQTPNADATPQGDFLAVATPSATGKGAVTPGSVLQRALAHDDSRFCPLTDADLDALLPAEGYVIVERPASYVPIMTPTRKLAATPSAHGDGGSSGFFLQRETSAIGSDAKHRLYGFSGRIPDDLPFAKPEDFQYFGRLLDGRTDDEIGVEEARERKVLKLLLKIKNGTPPIRRVALKTLVDKARELGAANVFNQLLPLLMSPTLDEQERHVFVKVVDRVLYRLDDAVKPFVHKILVVVEPMLIDEDFFARVEGREIIANLSKAAGLPSMIATMRPDVDHADEYVRNTTARAFAVVASALGVVNVLPFVRAVCASRKSWQARHTGVKIVQQIAILLGVGVLPFLRALVECVAAGVDDEQPKIRTMTALAIAALAEASAPYGIESFESVLKPLWKGLRLHRGKPLAAFVKAVGCVIPLMDTAYANYYSKEVMEVLCREFASPDDEMKKIVLKVLKQCSATEGISIDALKSDVLPAFFAAFWVRRMALDRRNYRAVVDTTVDLAARVGSPCVLAFLVDFVKDESDAFRRMALDAVERVLRAHGAASVESRLEERLLDALLFAFQEAATEDATAVAAFGAAIRAFGSRMKPYCVAICNAILWRITNKNAAVRMHAADLIGLMAGALDVCNEPKLLTHLCTVLYESLGEEYPEVLGSILAAYKVTIAAIGIERITPPAKDLLPRLTPILRNRHDKVQEACVGVVGRIAELAPEAASPREWMRICFELLDNLKAPRKSIRRACVHAFGFIAKCVGPQDVLVTLLNNLKVQERTNRISTTIAIAIVAEACGPFTVLPALMNEYRVPEQNVQNGVLKSLAFLCEYIGSASRDYVYAIAPLLEDALTDRDVVHRQMACSAVKHLAVAVSGLGARDALIHLLNYVWPNSLETSAHIVQTFFDALDGLRLACGAGILLMYVTQGLFHAARRIRDRCWKVYNQVYVAAQHSLVAFYPPLHEGAMAYKRHELDLFI